jgi:hypothetical protein
VLFWLNPAPAKPPIFSKPDGDSVAHRFGEDDMLSQATNAVAMDEGVALDDLAVGTEVEVETVHHTYRVKNLGNSEVLISGHPVYCPKPLVVKFIGSTMGFPDLRLAFIGPGMRMEFRHPERGLIHTSRVQSIRPVVQ